MTVRKYSSISQETTLTSALSSSATTMIVGSASGLLAGVTPGNTTPLETFTVVIDPDTALEEIVDVVYPSAPSSGTLTIVRGTGVDGTVGISHSAGAKVRHMAIGRDFREANTHIENSTTAHGLTIANVVLKDSTQTLTAKTLTSPVINGGTITGAAVTGLSAPSAGTDATTKTYVDGILGSATSAAASATAAAASAVTSGNSATTSTTQAGIATSAATTATNAATTATTQAGNASTSAGAASSSATAASGSAATATTKAGEAVTSATNAANSATAASTSAGNASTSATASANSATASAGSATNAANSYTAVVGQTGSGIVRDMGSITDTDTTTGSYVSIATIAANASNSATAASTSASNASNSATAAATSASNAATYATNAANSATAAGTQATNAGTSATAAASSATAASGSSTTASNWATQLSTPVSGSDYSAKYNANLAATSASDAATSASNAAAAAAAAVTGKLDKSGGTMTGALILNADPTNALGAVTKQYADAITAAINFHAPVKLATTANLATTYSNGTSGVGATLTATGNGRGSIDGVNISTNDRILVKNQTADLQNGIYTVTNQGGAGNAYILTRATDYDTSGEIANGDVIFTTAGNANSGVTFVNSTTNGTTITVGTTSITFSTYTSASLPTQTGNAGYYLTTDGTVPSWGAVNALPTQTGNSGKYLTTNGTASSWAAITTDPLPQIMMMMGA